MINRKVAHGGDQDHLIPNGSGYSNLFPSYTEFKNTGPLLYSRSECKLLCSKVSGAPVSRMPYYIQLVYKAVP